MNNNKNILYLNQKQESCPCTNNKYLQELETLNDKDINRGTEKLRKVQNHFEQFLDKNSLNETSRKKFLLIYKEIISIQERIKLLSTYEANLDTIELAEKYLLIYMDIGKIADKWRFLSNEDSDFHSNDINRDYFKDIHSIFEDIAKQKFKDTGLRTERRGWG